MLTPKTTTELLSGFYDGFQEPFEGEIYDWANKHVDLKAPFSITGPFDVSLSPYLIKPFKALKDPKVKEVNILKAVQTGGSLLLQIYLMWMVCNRPGSTLLLSQPGDMSKTIMETKLIPLIRNTPVVNDMIPNKRYAVKKDLISFPHIDVIVSPAKETMLQSLSIQYLLMDEVWLYRKGDIEQAKARTRAHAHHSKIVCAAQAGNAGDDWHEQSKSARHQFEWGYSCPQCNTLQPYKWGVKREDGTYAGMTWDKNEITCPDGQWNYEEAGKTARIECINVDCKHKVYDTPQNRDTLNVRGDYIETINPKGKSNCHTYHWPAWAMKNQSFASIVERYLQGKQDAKFGNIVKIQDFWQKDLAQFYTPQAVVDNIKILTEEYDSKDAYGDYTFLTVDCQQDLVQLYWVIRSWMKNGDSRQIARGVATSFAEIKEIQKQYNITPNNVAVDSGYQATQVYKECIKNGDIFTLKGKKTRICWNAFKGSDKWEFTHNGGIKKIYSERANGDPVDAAFKGMYAPLYLWSNYQFKNMLQLLMKGKLAKWVVNNNDEDFEKQMNSEILVPEINKRTNKEIQIWKQKTGVANHYFDCELQQLVMATMVGCIGDSSNKG